MREIKFRGWTASTKQMICEGWNETGAASFFIAKGDLFDYGDSMQIMQYTGLKDKNGKEIYEGDIVRYWGGVNEVVFINGRFCVRYTHADFFDLSAAGKEEIIGNIYQNPELLKP